MRGSWFPVCLKTRESQNLAFTDPAAITHALTNTYTVFVSTLASRCGGK